MIPGILAGSSCCWGTLVPSASREGKWLLWGWFPCLLKHPSLLVDERYSPCQMDIKIGLSNKLQDPSME